MKKCTLILALIVIFTASTCAQSCGDLDSTFGAKGIVTTNIGGSYDYGRSVAIQQDGKIVIAGYSFNDSNYDFALVRYNSDGSLDTTFSADGMATTDIGNSSDYGRSVAIQEDGKIVIAGYSGHCGSYDFALIRYNTDGTLDTTFSSNGKVTTDIDGSTDFGYSVAIQQDGKIVVAGYSYNGLTNDFALVRYNTNGSLDTTFSADGKVITDIGGSDDEGNSVAIQEDGKILAAGEFNNGLNYDFALIRYNTDGSLDTTFSTDGIVTTDINGFDDEGQSVAIQEDGKIVVAGYSYNGSANDFALIRYNTDGSLDTDFSSSGIITTDIGGSDDIGYSISIQEDEKIVIVGGSSNGSNGSFALIRYNTDGSLDTTFFTDGIVTTDMDSSYVTGFSGAIQQDGKIVVAGYSYNGSTYNFALARYACENTSVISIVDHENEIAIYPNPANDKIEIEQKKYTKGLIIEIYNEQGQLLLEQPMQHKKTEINISGLTKGMYFVRMGTEKGIFVRKFIKE